METPLVAVEPILYASQIVVPNCYSTLRDLSSQLFFMENNIQQKSLFFILIVDLQLRTAVSARRLFGWDEII